MRNKKIMWSIFINKLPDIAIGFAIPIITWIFKIFIWDKFQNYIYIKNALFKLDGTWFARHGVYYDPNIDIIEIIMIKQKSESIVLRIEQYKSNKNSVIKFYGSGIIKSNYVSLYYAAKESDSKQTGVMTLEVKDNKSITYLSGCYYELCDDQKEYGFTNYPKNFYKAYRLKLSKIEKLKSLFKISLFKNYDCAKDHINERG